MSRYTYKCRHGHHFDVTRRLNKKSQMKCPEKKCPETKFKRVYKSPLNIVFRGSGFYSKDNPKK